MVGFVGTQALGAAATKTSNAVPPRPAAGASSAGYGLPRGEYSPSTPAVARAFAREVGKVYGADPDPTDITATWGPRAQALARIGEEVPRLASQTTQNAQVEVFSMSGRFTPPALPPSEQNETFRWLTFVVDLSTGKVTNFSLNQEKPDMTGLGHQVVDLGS